MARPKRKGRNASVNETAPQESSRAENANEGRENENEQGSNLAAEGDEEELASGPLQQLAVSGITPKIQ